MKLLSKLGAVATGGLSKLGKGKALTAATGGLSKVAGRAFGKKRSMGGKR